MKKQWILFFFFCQSVIFAQDVSDFNSLSVSGNFDVTLISSNESKVDIVSSSVDNSDIIIEVKGEKLKIKFKEKVRGKKKAKLNVYFSSLESISTSASADVSSSDIIKSDEFDLDASSGSHVNITVEVNELDSDVSSGASVNISGSSKSQLVDISSGAKYYGSDMKSEYADVDVSSGAKVYVNASASLKADVNSGGSVRYTGNPTKIKAETNSGGSVKKSE